MNRTFTKRDTQVVKGIAILLMLTYHLFENADLVERLSVNYAPFSLEVFLTISGFGNMCVAVFAFLSAYGITKGLMALSAEESGLRKMYEQATGRCARLIGNFAIMFISVNALWFYKFDYKGLYGGGWQGFLLAVLDGCGLAHFFDAPTLNATWWYMELAVLIIFMVPLMYLAVKNIGSRVLVLALLLPMAVSMDFDLQRYFFVVVLGTVAAWMALPEKLLNWKLGKLWKALLVLALLVVCVLFRQNYIVYTYFAWIVDAPIALFLVWAGAELFAGIPGVSGCLAFLGKHSMNIYFIHTFFYMSIYQPYIYMFHYAGVILVVLTAVCLVYSVLLEGIKSLIRIFTRRIKASKDCA